MSINYTIQVSRWAGKGDFNYLAALGFSINLGCFLGCFDYKMRQLVIVFGLEKLIWEGFIVDIKDKANPLHLKIYFWSFKCNIIGFIPNDHQWLLEEGYFISGWGHRINRSNIFWSVQKKRTIVIGSVGNRKRFEVWPSINRSPKIILSPICAVSLILIEKTFQNIIRLIINIPDEILPLAHRLLLLQYWRYIKHIKS